MKEDRPSFTAVVVAFIVIMLGETAYPLLPPGSLPIQMALMEAVGLPWDEYLFLLLLRSPIGPLWSRFVQWFAGLFCTHALEGVGFRKSFIQKQVEQFLHQHKQSSSTSTAQVLILGAGYDTLSLRLSPEYPEVKFLEIDHPATGNFKNKIWDNENESFSKGHLRILGSKPANLHHACVDLTQKNSLAKTLESLGEEKYNTSSPTVVIIEGLSMYLTKAQVKSVLEDVSHAVGPKSLVTFDMLATKYNDKNEQHIDAGILGPLVSLYLKYIVGEALYFGLDTKILAEILAEPDTKWSQASKVEPFGTLVLAAIRLK